MLASHTYFETTLASRYLGQLCKHFAHRVEASCTETEGQVALEPGPATFAADREGLSIVVTGRDAPALEVARLTVEEHLHLYAFKEEPDALHWSDPINLSE